MVGSVTIHPILSLFAELLVPSPSGREEKLAAIVGQKLKAMDYVFESDAVGNITVPLEGRDPSAGMCMLAAHMDEIGMMVSPIAVQLV